MSLQRKSLLGATLTGTEPAAVDYYVHIEMK